jgi:hypothetical protein
VVVELSPENKSVVFLVVKHCNNALGITAWAGLLTVGRGTHGTPYKLNTWVAWSFCLKGNSIGCTLYSQLEPGRE